MLDKLGDSVSSQLGLAKAFYEVRHSSIASWHKNSLHDNFSPTSALTVIHRLDFNGAKKTRCDGLWYAKGMNVGMTLLAAYARKRKKEKKKVKKRRRRRRINKISQQGSRGAEPTFQA